MMVRVNITTSAAAESVSLSLSMTIITYRPAWHSQAPWGYYNWNGLDLGGDIKSIKKINYGEPVEY